MQYAGIVFISQRMYAFKIVIGKALSLLHNYLIQRIGNNCEKQYILMLEIKNLQD